MEILVRDDRLDIGVVRIGRRLGRGQDVFVVEDVEALVLHRAHVEVGHGDDVEHVEIVFAAEDLLVPAHGALERIERVVGAVFLAGLDIDGELDLAPARGREGLGDAAEAAADEGEEIGGLGVRVVPDGVMPVRAFDGAALDQVAVAEKDRRLVAVGLDARGVDAEHVGTVEEIGDAAEALGLALGAVIAARAVEAHELGVRGRVDLGLDGQA